MEFSDEIKQALAVVKDKEYQLGGGNGFIIIKDIEHHRNGSGGASFYVVVFYNDEKSAMMATVFEEKGHVAVLDMYLVSQFRVASYENGWRCEAFEPPLRQAIKEYEEEQNRLRSQQTV